MSTRLVRRRSGRPSYAIVTSPSPLEPVGLVFVVLGNEVTDTIGWCGTPTGRPPLPEEPKRNGAGRTGRHEQRTFTDADRERALELVSNGMTWSAVAEEVGCSKGAVGDWVRRAKNAAGNGDRAAGRVGPRPGQVDV